MSFSKSLTKLSAITIGVVLISGTTTAHSSVIAFSDRTVWSSAVGGPVATEDFESFNSIQEFVTNPVSILNGSIQRVNSSIPEALPFNRISAEPGGFGGDYDVNGTIQVNARIDNFVANTSDARVRLDFTTGVSAWGADFRSISTTNTVLDIFDAGDVLIGSVTAPIRDAFFGFNLDAGEVAASIQFRYLADSQDLFAFDDMSFVAAPSIPESSTLTIFALGLAALGIARRKTAI
ncbi:MAG: hypothetical protein GKS01_02415 [Alphaproteobacteria bacterium]|nr:hypothetical protein [Alphaproteobacteria bacterium]